MISTLEPSDEFHHPNASSLSESVASVVSRIRRCPREDWLTALREDQATRWRSGEPVLVESYLCCWPELTADVEETLVLICGEVRLRREAGQMVTLEEYASRFPHLATQLRIQFQLEQILSTSFDEDDKPIRCPCCHNSFGFAERTGDDELVCPSCGSNFRLLKDWAEDGIRCAAERKLGKYEVLERVGVGSFGVVYRARDPELDRIVAVKVPRSGNWAVQEDVERFLREARSVARLTHPSIIPVYEIGQSDQTPYLVTEFVQGETLSDVLSSRRPAPRDAAALVATVADALHYAHEMGVVHRDVKPANIMLDKKGTPRLMDFGLARRETGDVTMTMDGQVLGTPAYMSPEQARGDSRKVDGRSDVYSLGVILYQLLTGELPFRGTTRMLLHQVLHDEPRRPRSLSHLVPRDLETICLRAMAKEPAGRYGTSREMADDLRRFLGGEPIHARPIGGAERLWRWSRRKPTLAGLIAAVGVLLLSISMGGLIMGNYFRFQARQERLLRGEADENLYFNRISLADHELAFDDLHRAQELLDSCPERLKGWEWGYLKRRCRFEPAVFYGPAEGLNSVAFSHDGARLVAAGEDGTLSVFDVTTGQLQKKIQAHSKSVFSVACHPDGTYIASAGADNKVRLWNLATQKVLFEKNGHAGAYVGAAYALAFSPDGKRLAYGSDARTVTVCDVVSGERIFELGEHEGLPAAVAFSPNNSLLATGSFGGELRIWKAADGTLIRAFAGAHQRAVGAVGFSHDGRLLATGGFDRLIHVWDTTTWHVVHSLTGHSGLVVGLAFSPDDQRLASSGEDKTVRLWQPLTGRDILTIHDHTLHCECIAFHRNGLLASCSLDGTVRLYDPTTSEDRLETWTLEHEDEVWMVAFSPDGRQLASSGWDNRVRLWSPLTGIAEHSLPHPGEVMGFSYSPDGRLLAANVRSTGRESAGITVWNPLRGRPIGPPLEAVSLKFTVRFSPDSRYILAEDKSHTIGVWDVRTRQQIGSFGEPEKELWCLQFSPDGKRLLSASNDYMVKVWPWDGDRFGHVKNPLTRLPIVRLNGQGNRATFSHDGKRLITGGEEHTVKIWDSTSGELLHVLRGHTGDVFAVAASPDGRWLASGGEDTTIRLWDAETGEAKDKLRGHIGVISSLAFSPDSRLLASGCRDNTVKIWDLERIEARHADVHLVRSGG